MDFDFSGYSFYLHPGAYDMRSGIWSLLSGIERMGLDIHSKTVFMFCSRSRQVMRAVVWHDGYWLLQKSLGRGAFRWPDTREEAERLGYYLDRREELRRFLDYPFVTSSNQKGLLSSERSPGMRPEGRDSSSASPIRGPRSPRSTTPSSRHARQRG